MKHAQICGVFFVITRIVMEFGLIFLRKKTLCVTFGFLLLIIKIMMIMMMMMMIIIIIIDDNVYGAVIMTESMEI